MNLKVTGKRILLGVGLSVLFIVVCVGNVASGKWTIEPAVLIAVAGALLVSGIAYPVVRTAGVVWVNRRTRKWPDLLRLNSSTSLIFYGFTTRKLLVTEKTEETCLTRIVHRPLSVSLFTTPSKVT